MANVLAPNTAELQQMRVEITQLLHTSALTEEYKKSLMVILPYLPSLRLKPIYEQLQKEQALRAKPTGLTVREAKHALAQIRREAWKAAEKENTEKSNELETQFLQQISDL